MGKFLAYNPNNSDEDDARSIEAFDAEDAAEKYAEQDDRRSAEYTYAREGGEVMVRAAESSDPWVRYEITGEAVPVYHAHEARPTPRADAGHDASGKGGEDELKR